MACNSIMDLYRICFSDLFFFKSVEGKKGVCVFEWRIMDPIRLFIAACMCFDEAHFSRLHRFVSF